jgi:hypothetical protein
MLESMWNIQVIPKRANALQTKRAFYAGAQALQCEEGTDAEPRID